ncbi:MAG: hypothetical protein QXF01_00205 [Candidatus Micrarchaeaceae archaeon]
MDRRETGPHESAYQRDLKMQEELGESNYSDKVIENGKAYRVPYSIVKQVEFSNLKREELIDIEHAARLQYRLLLNDAILKAKVEFSKLKITIVYNPTEAKNIKEKISLEGIIDFLAGEGVHVDQNSIAVSDFDYYKNMYAYQFDPPSIREHPPYTYTMEQWKKIKAKYEENVRKSETKKLEKFHEWQNAYSAEHPEMGLGAIETAGSKKSFLGKVFGSKKKKANKQEKGFWFHGV